MQFTEEIKSRLQKIRQFRLQEDRAILLSCFGIALVFWVLVKLSQEYTSSKVVAFAYETPDDLALASIPPNDVYATLRGTGWNLMFEHLSGSAIPVRLTMEEIGEYNWNRIQLRNQIQESLSSNELTIPEVNYDAIRISVEEKGSKKIPVIPQVALKFAPEHHQRAPLQVNPDSITLTGAVSVIGPYQHWVTDTLSRDGLTNTSTFSVFLQEAPPEVQLSHEKVEITIPVEAYTEKSFFVPVSLVNPPADSLKVFPDKIKVSFVVGLSLYDSIRYTDFKLVADLKAASHEKGKNTVPVELVESPVRVNNVVLSRKSVEFFILRPEEKQETPK